MPIQEYKCVRCESQFEVLISRGSSAEVQCPTCSGSDVDRLIGLPAGISVKQPQSPTNCAGDGPPCGKMNCGRMKNKY